ncbi:hypothetical protein Aduo_018561 [Ancylostoma duodenale]
MFAHSLYGFTISSPYISQMHISSIFSFSEMNRDNVISALQATTVGDNQKVESFLDEVGFAFLSVIFK